MLRRRRAVLSGCLALLLLPSRVSGEIRLPDPSEGQINGKLAMLVWPHGPGRTLLPPDGCEVHLVPQTDRNQELVFPCGKWFQPPAGRYRGWLEQGQTMSFAPWLAGYSPAPFKGRGMTLVAPVVPAGWVRLSRTKRLESREHLRLAHLDSHLHEGGFGRLLDRRVPPHRATESVRMPAGEILAARFQDDHAVAISRPVRIRAGQTTELWPELPKQGSDVLVVLDRASAKEDSSAPFLTIEDRRLPADVLISAADRMIAVWYGVAGRSAQLTVVSDTAFLAEQRLSLRPGSVTTYRGKLQARPSLRVTVTAPEAFGTEEMEVEVMAQGVIRTSAVKVMETTLIERVPAAPLELVLRAGKWRFNRSVDLSDGEDSEVLFDLKPVNVSGTVSRGNDPVPGAEVSFQITGRDEESARTDSEGEYRLTLWRETHYPVLVRLPGVTGPPIMELVSVTAGATLDFSFPDNEYRVEVIDSVSGKAIKAARVQVDHTWLDHGARRKTSQTAITDDSGRIVLPPLREGSLLLKASANGYRNASLEEFQVSAFSRGEDFVIRLEREETARELHILLPGGFPADGAEVWLLREGTISPFWRGMSGPDGKVGVPLVEVPSIVLIRHRGAGSLARRYTPEMTSLTMPPAATPLRIRIQRADQGPAGSAPLALLTDDLRILGPPLGFLAWSPALADRNGIWTGTNLPAKSVRVISWARTAAAAEGGSFDSMATSIRYPWPQEVTINAVE
jgi:hypothetical protein